MGITATTWWTTHWLAELHFLWWRTISRSHWSSHTCRTIIVPCLSPWRHASIVHVTRATSWKWSTTYKTSISTGSNSRQLTDIRFTFNFHFHSFASAFIFLSFSCFWCQLHSYYVYLEIWKFCSYSSTTNTCFTNKTEHFVQHSTKWKWLIYVMLPEVRKESFHNTPDLNLTWKQN